MEFNRNCDLVCLLGGFESAIRFVCNWTDLSLSLLVDDNGHFNGNLSFTQDNANLLELFKEFLGSAAQCILVKDPDHPTRKNCCYFDREQARGWREMMNGNEDGSYEDDLGEIAKRRRIEH